MHRIQSEMAGLIQKSVETPQKHCLLVQLFFVQLSFVQRSFIARPHQLHWGDWEMGTAISCMEYSQMAISCIECSQMAGLMLKANQRTKTGEAWERGYQNNMPMAG